MPRHQRLYLALRFAFQEVGDPARSEALAAEYDALLTIADAPERRIRMRQLADRVILSKSGVTRLIDRLGQTRVLVPAVRART